MTNADILNELIIIYRNEKNIKTLLPYQTSIIETIYSLIQSQQTYLNALKKNQIIKNIIEQELDTAKYFLKEYLKIRIKKLQIYFLTSKDLLSSKEIIFQEKIVNLYKEKNIYVESEYKNTEYVGFICLKDIKQIFLDKNPVEIKNDDFFVAPLEEVYEYLYNNDIMIV
ncbi:hypothetical protein CWI38_1287p0010 [Hamiltosporidium tvaerminnensis]|uniref:DNA replication complex GINS protein SLD5 n=1 Tax=Hamiltosporidium tvaerminnensis TaxID=1176355 RepID=A0A4Q9LSL8_9MICR|nr:hypothetical protein CWI37_0928p0020 [Hamiltosporidium tvaerminnensis]TBU11277.1 hypothetical protein CWI38_1287p0010 [Hamiltosporidium tvaerminnensis]